MKKRILLLFLAIIFVFSACTKAPATNFETSSEKTFLLCISAPSENSEKITEYTSKYVYLGDFLEAEGLIEFEKSSYGRYLHSVDGISDNPDENLWWTVFVNGESALTGVDKIKLENGKEYKLELTKIE